MTPSLPPVSMASKMKKGVRLFFGPEDPSAEVTDDGPIRSCLDPGGELMALRRALVGLELTEAEDGFVDSLPGLRAWGVEALTLTHVARDSPLPRIHQVDPTAGVAGRLARANAWLSPFFQVQLCIRSGPVGACLAEEARHRHADLLVLGVAQRGRLQEAVVGSTVLDVLHRSEKPVMLFPHAVLRGRRGRPLISPDSTWILHPTDFSRASGRATAVARALALEKGFPITLLHVLEPWDPSPEEEARQGLARVASELNAAGVARVETVLERGTSWERILAVSAESENTLVVMGTRGRGRIPGAILGSQSREVARRIALPLLLVPTARPSGGRDSVASAPGPTYSEPPSL